ncbi:MAG: molybdopterin-dependent oxidoreductase, partial [Intestinibacter sp.]
MLLKRHFYINGVKRNLMVDPESSLATVLREQLMLTGCKIGCNQGHCGTCTVILNGKPVRSCIVKMKKVPEESVIETVEGLANGDELHPLQVAWMGHGCAQCGYCTPGFLMSSKALLAENPSPTREEVRDWFQKHKNLCRCTGYKPLVDAVMDAAAVMRGEKSVDDLIFKPVGNDILGTEYIRPSAKAKVTGTWDYGADMDLQMPEGTLKLALVQAEVSHALIKGIDYSEALKVPGVHKVITAKDVKGNNRINGLVFFPGYNKGDGWDRPVLCDEKVFQYGDAIAVVAADTEAIAREAAKLVKVDLEVLPAYMSAPEAMAEDAIEIHPGTPNVFYETKCIKGEDTAPLMETLPNVVEVETYSSRQPHLPLEPDCGQAYIDENGKLIIHSKSIGIHLHHMMICEGIGVAPEDCYIVQNPTGGTFGYKFSPTIESILGVCCLATGRPVSLVYTQYQQITYTGKRSPAFLKVKLGADENGKILALEGENYVDHGPYSEFGDLLTMRL